MISERHVFSLPATEVSDKKEVQLQHKSKDSSNQFTPGTAQRIMSLLRLREHEQEQQCDLRRRSDESTSWLSHIFLRSSMISRNWSSFHASRNTLKCRGLQLWPCSSRRPTLGGMRRGALAAGRNLKSIFISTRGVRARRTAERRQKLVAVYFQEREGALTLTRKGGGRRKNSCSALLRLLQSGVSLSFWKSLGAVVAEMLISTLRQRGPGAIEKNHGKSECRNGQSTIAAATAAVREMVRHLYDRIQHQLGDKAVAFACRLKKEIESRGQSCRSAAWFACSGVLRRFKQCRGRSFSKRDLKAGGKTNPLNSWPSWMVIGAKKTSSVYVFLLLLLLHTVQTVRQPLPHENMFDLVNQDPDEAAYDFWEGGSSPGRNSASGRRRTANGRRSSSSGGRRRGRRNKNKREEAGDSSATGRGREESAGTRRRKSSRASAESPSSSSTADTGSSASSWTEVQEGARGGKPSRESSTTESSRGGVPESAEEPQPPQVPVVPDNRKGPNATNGIECECFNLFRHKFINQFRTRAEVLLLLR